MAAVAGASKEIKVDSSKIQKTIQGKACHHCFEDLDAIIETALKGELHARWKCRTEEGRWVMKEGIEVRHGPRKEVYVIWIKMSIAAEEYALQRSNVLGSMEVLGDIREEILHITAGCNICYREAQRGEGW